MIKAKCSRCGIDVFNTDGVHICIADFNSVVSVDNREMIWQKDVRELTKAIKDLTEAIQKKSDK